MVFLPGEVFFYDSNTNVLLLETPCGSMLLPKTIQPSCLESLLPFGKSFFLSSTLQFAVCVLLHFILFSFLFLTVQMCAQILTINQQAVHVEDQTLNYGNQTDLILTKENILLGSCLINILQKQLKNLIVTQLAWSGFLGGT